MVLDENALRHTSLSGLDTATHSILLHTTPAGWWVQVSNGLLA